jgi:hypothetical protein
MRTFLSAMKIASVPLLFLFPVAANSQAASEKLIAPEIVRFEKMHIDDDTKTVTVGNANRHYLLSCSAKAAGCITPEPTKNYLLFDKNTRWRMPGATTLIDLAFVQDWTVLYKEAENIGLVPEQRGARHAWYVHA